jgi:hypothetical protein
MQTALRSRRPLFVLRHRAATTVIRNARSRQKSSFGIRKLWPNARTRGRWLRAFKRSSAATQLIAVIGIALTLWFAVNWVYQVVRKPSELFFPVSGALYKTPPETWDEYAPIFRKHSTSVITPDLLAALAQVEGSGSPVARTYWRWSLRPEPFEVYRPASSAVGMYQITDATFGEAKRYCIHNHIVVEDGPWTDFESCWFNSLYMRVVPAHAVAMTSGYLDRRVANTLSRLRIANATLQQKQDMAVVMHLCGTGAGALYAKRHFRLLSGQRCGDHDAQAYVARVNAMKRTFRELADKRRWTTASDHDVRFRLG